MKITSLHIVLFFICAFVSAQKNNNFNFNDSEFTDFTKSYKVDLSSEVKAIEEIAIDFEELDPVYINVYKFPKLKNKLDTQYYHYLHRKVHSIYPYFAKALREYNQIKDSMDTYGNKKEMKEKMKLRQDQIMKNYENTIRTKLTRKEGQIFTKLLYRDTGKTTYEIFKELRGGWSAFWMNTKANAFDIDLEEEFHPLDNREDYIIEVIVRNGLKSGTLRK